LKRTLVDILLFIVWVFTYLSIVYGIVRYRRARILALGTRDRGEYRADRDSMVRVAIFLVGILLGVAAYIALIALGRMS
jgi:hypothetical protein